MKNKHAMDSTYFYQNTMISRVERYGYLSTPSTINYQLSTKTDIESDGLPLPFYANTNFLKNIESLLKRIERWNYIYPHLAHDSA